MVDLDIGTGPGQTDLLSFLLTKQPYDGLRRAHSYAGGRKSQGPSKSSNQLGLTDQERIRQLAVTADRIRGEREALRRENAKLRTANEQWKIEADREKLRNDSTINNLHKRWREADD